MESFKDLIVWQKSMTLVRCIYEISVTLPDSEKFGLVSQMRRSAISIPSNIAEGSRRGHIKEYIQFLHIARGSLAELETQILISNELFQLNGKPALDLVEETGKMLNGLIKALKKKI